MSTKPTAHAENGVAFDMDVFKSKLPTLSSEEKNLALYWLLRDLLGDRPEKESCAEDPQGFVYMHFVPPGIREYLRTKEHPELLEKWTKAAEGPSIPIEEAREEIRKQLGVSKEEFYSYFPK